MPNDIILIKNKTIYVNTYSLYLCKTILDLLSGNLLYKK